METLGAARLAKEIPAQRAVATVVPREEIAAVLRDPEADPELYLRITEGGPEEAETSLISMSWSRADLEQLLKQATGENIVLTFDRDELSQAIVDVEAHGLRERALVFAVVAAGALGSGVGIANAMPVGDDGGPAVISVAPALAAADIRVTDASSGAGYTAPAAAADSLISDAASGAGYAAPAAAADTAVTDVSSAGGYAAPTSSADTVLTDVSSAGGYAVPTTESDLMISDAASGSGYTADVAQAGASGADALRTDVSSGGGYGPVESTGSSGEFLGIQQPDTTDALLAGGILLAIAGATFASRRGSGTIRPA